MIKQLTLTITSSANGSGDIQDELLSALDAVKNAVSNDIIKATDTKTQGDPDEDSDYIETKYELQITEIL